jgi:hypothetical protein
MVGKSKDRHQENIRQYEQLRSMSMRFSKEIPKLYGMDNFMSEIIQTFGVRQGKQIILESESEMDFMMDFYLHEILSNGQTLLERYRADTPNLGALETHYLDAAKASYTSLFKITGVNPAAGTLTIVDLLSSSDATIEVINLNLSRTASPDYIIFSRLLPYGEFNAFSGMYAVFDEKNERSLLKRYKVMKKRVKSDRDSVQRMVACFKMNRILGIQA